MDAKDLIRSINDHVPASRRSLLDYIESEDLTYRTRDGAVESKVVARILGRPQYRPDTVRFFHPDYRILLKRLPTSVIVLFIP